MYVKTQQPQKLALDALINPATAIRDAVHAYLFPCKLDPYFAYSGWIRYVARRSANFSPRASSPGYP